MLRTECDDTYSYYSKIKGKFDGASPNFVSFKESLFVVVCFGSQNFSDFLFFCLIM